MASDGRLSPRQLLTGSGAVGQQGRGGIVLNADDLGRNKIKGL